MVLDEANKKFGPNEEHALEFANGTIQPMLIHFGNRVRAKCAQLDIPEKMKGEIMLSWYLAIAYQIIGTLQENGVDVVGNMKRDGLFKEK